MFDLACPLCHIGARCGFVYSPWRCWHWDDKLTNRTSQIDEYSGFIADSTINL